MMLPFFMVGLSSGMSILSGIGTFHLTFCAIKFCGILTAKSTGKTA
jgi:hypothetical protein